MNYKSEFDREEQLFIDRTINFFLALEIKDQKEADKYENREIYEEAKYFTDAVLKFDLFEHHTFKKEELMRVLGMTDDVAKKHIENKYSYLTEYQKNKLLEYKRTYIIQNYEEKNNYYRCRMGLPDYGETPLKIKGKYVTELSNNEINFTYHEELKKLIADNPSKKYLKYLGVKAIDLTFMRTSPDLSIIYYDRSIFSDALNKVLISHYYECLGYVKSVLYTDAFEDQNYYHKFMILFNCFMTMQKFINTRIEFAINREFFDEESMKNMFKSYDLPYWQNLPVKYKKRIIKNINTLIMNKGTNKVLMDIVNLFGFENVEIFRHYIVKNEVTDPITQEGTGEYDLQFVGIPIDSDNIIKSISESTFIESYEDVVRNDPYWDGDSGDTIKQVLLEQEFNSINTKYLSMNTMYDVCQLTNEVTYFFNMLDKMESRNLLDDFTFINSKIKPNGNPIRFYDAIVAIYHLVCKRLQVEDRILYSSTAIASVYGFNFDGDLQELKNNLNDVTLSSEYLRTVKELPLGLMQKKDLIEIFFDNNTYKNTLQEAMIYTSDYKTYKSLKQIYYYNMVAEYVDTQFSKSDGGRYETYLEYLYDRDGELAEYVVDNSADDELILIALNEILFSLEVFIDSDKFKFVFLGLSTLVSDLIKEYMKTLINFFKAYTVDLRDMSVYYIFDDRFTNTIKLLNDVKMEIDRKFYGGQVWMEDIETFLKDMGIKDKLEYEDIIKLISTLSLEDIYKMNDQLGEIIQKITMTDGVLFVDVEDFNLQKEYEDNLEYIESLAYTQQITELDKIKLMNLLILKTNFNLIDNLSSSIQDIETIISLLKHEEKANIKDRDYITSLLSGIDKYKLIDNFEKVSNITKTNFINILDIIDLSRNQILDQDLGLEEKSVRMSEITNNYKLILKNIIESSDSCRIEGDLSVDLIESLFNSDTIIEHKNNVKLKETFKIERNEEENGN